MDIGKTIIILGVVLVIVGGLFTLLQNSGIPKLPGDILIKRGNSTFYFPIVTSIVISIILSIILNLVTRR